MQPERLVVAREVAVHVAPVGVVRDLELEPLVPACGVGEVPRVDRVRALHQAPAGIPVPRVRHDVAQRALQARQERGHPRVVSRRLPREIRRLHEPVLDVRFDGHADVFRPVLTFARRLLGKRRDVVEHPAVRGLRVGEMLHRAREVRLEVPERPHHVAVVPDPHRPRVRRAVAADARAVDGQIQGALLEEPPHQREQPVELRTARPDHRLNGHRS